MELILDGKKILNKEILFDTLKEQINSEDFYGNNLDSLWDVLSYGIENVLVTIKNNADLEINLGEYLSKLIQLFKDLNNTNVNVTINIK